MGNIDTKVRPKTSALPPSTLYDAEIVEFYGARHLKTVQHMPPNEALPIFRVKMHCNTAELDLNFNPEEEIE